jgi:hypothetical protein
VIAGERVKGGLIVEIQKEPATASLTKIAALTGLWCLALK